MFHCHTLPNIFKQNDPQNSDLVLEKRRHINYTESCAVLDINLKKTEYLNRCQRNCMCSSICDQVYKRIFEKKETSMCGGQNCF